MFNPSETAVYGQMAKMHNVLEAGANQIMYAEILGSANISKNLGFPNTLVKSEIGEFLMLDDTWMVVPYIHELNIGANAN